MVTLEGTCASTVSVTMGMITWEINRFYFQIRIEPVYFIVIDLYWISHGSLMLTRY